MLRQNPHLHRRVQFYKGIASPDEALVVLRETRNRYDCNAFRINKANGKQVGYVPTYLARKLAPLVDRGLITLKMRAAGPVAANIEVFGVGTMDARVRKLLRSTEESGRFSLDPPMSWSSAVLQLLVRYRYSHGILTNTRTRPSKTAIEEFAKKSAKKKSAKKAAKKAARRLKQTRT